MAREVHLWCSRCSPALSPGPPLVPPHLPTSPSSPFTSEQLSSPSHLTTADHNQNNMIPTNPSGGKHTTQYHNMTYDCLYGKGIQSNSSKTPPHGAETCSDKGDLFDFPKSFHLLIGQGKMGRVYCAVKLCKRNSVKHKNISFYRIPVDSR